MWNTRREATKSSKISGNAVREVLNSILAKLWVGLPEREVEKESLATAQAQDSIVSVVDKAKSIFNIMATKHNQEEVGEEEILITVKRKRRNTMPSYQLTLSFIPALVHVPAKGNEDPAAQCEMSGSDQGSDKLSEISRNVSKFLAEIRSSSC